MRGPERISSYPSAAAFAELKIFLNSSFETGAGNNEWICLSVKYFSGEPVCNSTEVDKMGLYKQTNELNFSQIVLCQPRFLHLLPCILFGLELLWFFSSYSFDNCPCFPHISFVNSYFPDNRFSHGIIHSIHIISIVFIFTVVVNSLASFALMVQFIFCLEVFCGLC